MRELKSVYSIILSLLVLLCVGAGSALASSAAIKVVPSVATATVGDSFDLLIQVSDAVDLYAFQYDLTFDASEVNGTGMSEGTFLPSGGSTIFMSGLIDNGVGAVTYTADTLVGDLPGVNGDGLLVDMKIKAIGNGQAVFDLSNVVFLDSTLTEVPSETVSGSVLISPSTAIPEPATLLLVGFGLAGLFSLYRWRKQSPKRRFQE